LRFFPQFDFLQLETTVAISDTIPKWALLFQFKIVKLNYEEIWRRLKVEDPHNGRGKRDEGNSQAQKTAAMIRRRQAWRWHSRILRLKEGEERCCDFWERREDFAIEGRRREMLRFLRKKRDLWESEEREWVMSCFRNSVDMDLKKLKLNENWCI
jgi:hypothetical protein